MYLNLDFLNQRNFAITLLLALALNIAIGGILLPYREANAVLATLPMQIIQWVEEVATDIWNKIEEVYDAAANWISANIATLQWEDTWYQRALSAAWWILRKKLLNMLVDDIVKWIQGGGTPKAVTDWKGFLSDAANQAGGQFVAQYLGAGFLCQPFQARLQFALANPPPFNIQTTCTLSKIGTNINNFFNNFSNGGWKGWITINETQNNLYGAYLTALNQKIGVQADAAQAAQNEAVASSGFLGDKRCTSIYETANPSNTGNYAASPLQQADIPAGWTCSNWIIYTPGKIAAESLVQAANIDIPWLLSAREFEEYAGAIIDAVINRAVKQGVLYMTAPSGGSSNPANAGAGTTPPTVNNSAFQDATQNAGPASALVDQLNLYKQNLNNELGQEQTNLGVLNQIRAGYLGPLGTLSQIIQRGNCPIPAGVTQTLTNTTQTSDCAQNCPCTVTTTDNYSIASPVGSMTQQKITAQQNGESTYDQTVDSNICAPPVPVETTACAFSCALTSTVSYNVTNLPGTPIDGEITNVTNKINSINSQLAQIDTTITNVSAYAQTAKQYLTAYQNAQQGDANAQAQLPAAEQTMATTKNAAVTSLQTSLSTATTDFQMFLQTAQNANMQAAQATADAQMTRGITSDCSAVQANTYYATLCGVQGIQNQYTDDLDNCP